MKEKSIQTKRRTKTGDIFLFVYAASPLLKISSKACNYLEKRPWFRSLGF